MNGVAPGGRGDRDAHDSSGDNALALRSTSSATRLHCSRFALQIGVCQVHSVNFAVYLIHAAGTG